jgi:hypothetical protein
LITDPFPGEALDANRSGHLTPDQVTLYRAEAATDRRNLLFGGLAVMAFGAVIVFGAVSGKAPGSRVETLAVGAAIVVVGALVAWFGGIAGSRAKSAAAGAGRVTMVEGPFRRERRDREGSYSGHVSPGNEYEYYLLLGDRSFSVSQAQWEAAPEDGVVRLYLLGSSDRIVNLERIADAPPPQVPAIVRAALERAASSGNADQAAHARAILDQAAAMGVAAAAASPAMPDVAGVDATPLDRAILGTWHSDLMGGKYEFRADGVAVATSGRAGAREQRWSIAGPDIIRLDDATLHAAVAGDTLSLGEPGRPLAFTRVG